MQIMKNWARGALCLSLLIGAQLFSGALYGAENRWKQTHAKNGECCIEFPSQPEMIQQSLPIGESGHQLSYDVYLSPFEDKGVFLLLVATYPSPMSGGKEIAGLEGLIRGILGHHPENELMFADLVDHGGHPAVNFLVQSGKSYFRGHALMVGNKLFLIAMEGKKGEMNEGIFSRFLKSFQLMR